MSTSLLPWLPVALPLMGAIGLSLLAGRLRLRLLSGPAAIVLVAAALAALTSRLGWPDTTTTVPWLAAGTFAQDLQLSWRGGRNLMLAALFALSAGSVLAIGSAAPREGRAGATGLGGLLFACAGNALAIGASAPLIGAVGAGIAGIGALIMELSSIPSDRDARFGGLAGLSVGCTLLVLAAFFDPSLGTSAPVWGAGALLIWSSGPLRSSDPRLPPLWRLMLVVLGPSVAGGWLLVNSITTTPGLWLARDLLVLATIGGSLLLGGAFRVVTAAQLGQVLAGTAVAQIGMVLLALGQRGPALALLIHALWTTALLGWSLATLHGAAGGDRIAALLPPSAPLRRCALVYGIAGGSVLGLPLLSGYGLRETLFGQLAPPGQALLLIGHAMLALGLLPPLAAMLRHSVRATEGVEREPGARAALLGALLVMAGTGWDAIRPALIDPGSAALSTRASGGLFRLGCGMLIVGFAARALRRLDAPPSFNGGLAPQEEGGWALPWHGLRAVVGINYLADHALPGALERGRELLASQTRNAWQRIGGRYYVSIVVAIVVALLVLLESQRLH
ncbi:MAG: hypothetical protein NVS4B8_21860 [Herpetosiphon sp.]